MKSICYFRISIAQQILLQSSDKQLAHDTTLFYLDFHNNVIHKAVIG